MHPEAWIARPSKTRLKMTQTQELPPFAGSSLRAEVDL